MVEEEGPKEEGPKEEGPKEEGEVPSLPPYTHDDQQDLPHTYIVKGKRTKRQRPQSPIPFIITTHMTQHSSSGDGGGDVSNGDHHVINNKTSNIIINHNSSSSSDGHDDAPCPNYNTTTEDEYTARCLILLAQGSQNVEPTRKYDQDNYSVPEKFNSKRYIEAPISGNGKAGMYVYECKTCGRTFPSFQALGGHRASHKKPKNIAAAEEKKMFINDYLSDEDEEEMTLFKKQKTSTNRNSNNYSSLSLEFNMGNMGIHKSASFPRIHECSHCGAEFTSGQALGGHMRRHRGAAPVANTTLSLGHSNQEEAADLQDSDQKNGLSLDLNLPAPEDDHHHHHNKESRFGLPPKQQKNEEKQAALVLSTATKLVECRY